MPNRPTRPGKHAARHKAPSAWSRAVERLTPGAPQLGVRRTGGTLVALGSVVLAGAATGAAASGGDAPEPSTTPMAAMRLPDAGRLTAAETSARAAQLSDASRAQIRTSVAEMRNHGTAPTTRSTGSTTAQAESIVPEDPRAIARMMLVDYGWDESEFSCLDALYVSESNWDVNATNPTSGAYGIPQSLPAEKMATAGADWRTNPATQIEWGLEYIESSYGTPCSAWEFKQANNWY
ncbi:MAG: transglycosylase SLT domain-containing protein [Nocardioidaceae bacterium]